MINLNRITRQKRRLVTFAFGGLLAVFAAFGPTFGVLGFLLFVGLGSAVILRAPAQRTWLETAGLGMALGVLFSLISPFAAIFEVPTFSAFFVAVARVALYGQWGERLNIWRPLRLSQTTQINQPPRAVWAAAAPGGGQPYEVFPGSVEEVFLDEDDPETIYLAHLDGREDTITFLARQAPEEARFLRLRDGERGEARVCLKINEFSLGQSFVTMDVAYDALRPAEVFVRFFDDALGDEMDSLAAWLEDREDSSLFALRYPRRRALGEALPEPRRLAAE